jgi:hypothetical protein
VTPEHQRKSWIILPIRDENRKFRFSPEDCTTVGAWKLDSIKRRLPSNKRRSHPVSCPIVPAKHPNIRCDMHDLCPVQLTVKALLQFYHQSIPNDAVHRRQRLKHLLVSEVRLTNMICNPLQVQYVMYLNVMYSRNTCA